MSKSQNCTPLEATIKQEEIIQKMNEELKKVSFGSKVVHWNYIDWQLKNVLGKVLTIIDASIVDKQQNKCVKDLVKQSFYTQLDELLRWYEVEDIRNSQLLPYLE